MDGVDALREWAAKLSLRYPLVADASKEVCRAYEVVRDDWGLAGRGTVVIGQDGRVLRTYPDAPSRGHAERVLEDLRADR